MRLSEDVDVVVVGGGPGGSAASTLLARAGHRVVQLERDHHPRHQIGESLLPSTIHGLCGLLGVRDAVHDAGFMRKRGGTFRWGAQDEPWTFAFEGVSPKGEDYAFQVERARFDALLFEHARDVGVDTREGIEVLRATRDDHGTVTGVETRDDAGRAGLLRARYVVDASGHGSRLARLAGRRVHSDFFRNVAVYGYYHGASRQPAPNSGNIISAAFQDGWCWFIPLSEELTSVGAVVDHRNAARIGEDREVALSAFVAQCPIVSDMLAGATRITDGMYGEVRIRKDWSYSNEAFTAPGLFLVGDAACFIDPVFSSGVHLATYSGMLAARSINTILAGEIDAQRCMQVFEDRYLAEFRLFYEFLVAFYDMRQEWDSYYWKARDLLATSERANEAFVRLVAGGATAPQDFFAEQAGAGQAFAAVVAKTAEAPERKTLRTEPQAADETRRLGAQPQQIKIVKGLARMRVLVDDSPDAPSSEDELVPSPDGLRWLPAAIS